MSDTEAFEITAELLEAFQITAEEYARIEQLIERTPNLVELGMFGAMWSEHCAYKHSRAALRDFPTAKQDPKSPFQVLVKAGEENAGVIDVGDGWGLCFKIESHNHPTAVEPFEGAATGIGGILRDIYTMGAQPVLFGNSLRFGLLSSPQSRRLFAGAVAGIGHYGNCVGLPNVAGDVSFDACYEGNPLVNALCLGALPTNAIRRGAAKGIGNLIYYVGAPTGRDGLGGASFASKELSESSALDRPAVQKGDPFLGKLLMEACLEMMACENLVVGIQDMGAAGLTCSICETAARGQVGITIDLDKVPQRETGMQAHEILLSESQERMLVIAEKGKEAVLEAVFAKWDLPAACIGQVVKGDCVKVLHQSQTVVHLPATALTDAAPVYQPEARAPAHLKQAESWSADALQPSSPKDLQKALEVLMGTPSLGSKRWVYRQYDHEVGASTLVKPGAADAGVLRIRCGALQKYVALAHDCVARHCQADPYNGAMAAVAECWSNLICTGATPIGMTNNLNFANPKKPENFYMFKECVRGLADACKALDLPVIGGNVSFYNETENGPIDPTPVVALCGLLESPKAIKPARVPADTSEGTLVLLGGFAESLGASAFLQWVHGQKVGRISKVCLQTHLSLADFLKAKSDFILAAHDVSEGGLLLSVCELLFGLERTFGAHLRLDIGERRAETALFGECSGRILTLTQKANAKALISSAKAMGLEAELLGDMLETDNLTVTLPSLPEPLNWKLQDLRNLYENSLERAMQAKPSEEIAL